VRRLLARFRPGRVQRLAHRPPRHAVVRSSSRIDMPSRWSRRRRIQLGLHIGGMNQHFGNQLGDDQGDVEGFAASRRRRSARRSMGARGRRGGGVRRSGGHRPASAAGSTAPAEPTDNPAGQRRHRSGRQSASRRVASERTTAAGPRRHTPAGETATAGTAAETSSTASPTLPVACSGRQRRGGDRPAFDPDGPRVMAGRGQARLGRHRAQGAAHGPWHAQGPPGPGAVRSMRWRSRRGPDLPACRYAAAADYQRRRAGTEPERVTLPDSLPARRPLAPREGSFRFPALPRPP
jgi:hypothetical protein